VTSVPGAERLIVALDVDTLAAALALAEKMEGVAGWLKVGLELFTAVGPDGVRALARRGRIMLDLKLHDIPETVARATARAADLGVGLLTLHTAGGRRMMTAAAAARGGVKLLGVTVLTSLDDRDLEEVGTGPSVAAVVARRAALAAEAGLDGVVSSPTEAAAIRSARGSDFLIVTPGVRPLGAAAGDQKRIATPAGARAAGADLVVVGRPIRDAADPRAAASAIAAELA
jgi:orotidine-5'-phosphate decarboxylase